MSGESKKYVIYSVRGETVEYISKNFQSNKGANNVVRYLQQAKVFDSFTKSNSFISSLPKTLKVNRNWQLSEVSIKDNKLQLIKKTHDLKKINILNMSTDEAIETTSSHYDATDNESSKYFDMIVQLKNNIEYLKNRLLQLNNELDLISKEQVDQEHYMEFNKLSGSFGYCAYKDFHDLRVKRRKVKDEIARINVVLDVFKTDLDFNKVENCLHKIDEQIYTPRIRFDLFK